MLPLKEEMQKLEEELKEVMMEWQKLMVAVPNIPDVSVPEGASDAENLAVRTWGEPRAAESVKPHWDVGAALGLFDLERGAKIAGSGFVVYRGTGARMMRAFTNAMLDLHTREFGYEELWVPTLVNRATMTGTV